MKELPSTFRDAVAVALKLDIFYLWIDSYCILQDESSNEDKEHEMAQMGEVYLNAILNIGAAWASSPMGGLFTRRSQNARKPIQITWDSGSSAANQSYLVYAENDLHDDYRDFSRPDRSTIFRRVWCLQERFLCPRMLHFCKSGLYWECDTIRTASDSLPVSWPWMLKVVDRPAFSIREAHARSRSSDPPLHHQWDKILNAYSEMELSRPAEDKLVACGGVAKQMAKLINDEYAAGFFRRDLITRLAWITSRYILNPRSQPVSRRAEQWRAPSWSWASVDGKIWMPRFRLEARAQIMALDCKLADPANPYGALVSAMITLKGWVADVEVDLVSSEYVWRGPTRISVSFDDADEPRKDLVILLTGTRAKDNEVLSADTDGVVLVPVKKNLSDQVNWCKRVGAFRGQQVIGAFEGLEAPDKMYPPFAERVVNII